MIQTVTNSIVMEFVSSAPLDFTLTSKENVKKYLMIALTSELQKKDVFNATLDMPWIKITTV